jgi:hypothetical protein
MSDGMPRIIQGRGSFVANAMSLQGTARKTEYLTMKVNPIAEIALSVPGFWNAMLQIDCIT